MIFADRTCSRWLAGCTVFAAWCAGSVWALFETTRAYPGVITMRPGRGAFELSEFVLGVPAGTAFLGLFLLSFVAMLMVGGLRNWLDPDRQAMDSIRWTFASASLNATLLFLVAIACLAVIAVGRRSDAWTACFFFSYLLGVCVTPFAGLNADTLMRPKLMRWWRLRWPGWRAALLASGVILAESASGLCLDMLASLGGPAWWLALSNAIDSVLFFLLWVFVAVAWILRGSLAAAWRSFRKLLRWRRLRALLWQGLFSTVLLTGFALPILAAAVLTIFVIPQYASWAESPGHALSWPLQMLAQAGSHNGGAVYPFILVGTVYLVLVRGRLLVVLLEEARPWDRLGATAVASTESG